MADESYNFTQARARLEEIVSQVRRKDVSLEKSLDLLEEGVRLANACTELIDHTEWRSVVTDEEMATAAEAAGEGPGAGGAADESAEADHHAVAGADASPPGETGDEGVQDDAGRSANTDEGGRDAGEPASDDAEPGDSDGS